MHDLAVRFKQRRQSGSQRSRTRGDRLRGRGRGVGRSSCRSGQPPVEWVWGEDEGARSHVDRRSMNVCAAGSALVVIVRLLAEGGRGEALMTACRAAGCNARERARGDRWPPAARRAGRAARSLAGGRVWSQQRDRATVDRARRERAARPRARRLGVVTRGRASARRRSAGRPPRRPTPLLQNRSTARQNRPASGPARAPA